MLSIPKLQAENPYATFGETKFADLSADEFLRRFTGLPKRGDWWDFEPDNNGDELYIDPSNSINDNEYDWRGRGVVTPVKEQGECGSCYAFSAVAAVESAVAIKNGGLMGLSVQQIVSCTDDYGVDGTVIQLYQIGVMSDPGFLVNHAVVTVGYGGSDPPYRIIKNSWGESYGENGYIRLERNVNACQIAGENYVPIH